MKKNVLIISCIFSIYWGFLIIQQYFFLVSGDMSVVTSTKIKPTHHVSTGDRLLVLQFSGKNFPYERFVDSDRTDGAFMYFNFDGAFSTDSCTIYRTRKGGVKIELIPNYPYPLPENFNIQLFLDSSGYIVNSKLPYWVRQIDLYSIVCPTAFSECLRTYFSFKYIYIKNSD
jgi:hypothetical protein